MRPDWFSAGSWPLIGVVHLRALPGAPDARDTLEAIVAHARDEVAAYLAGGVRCLVIENYGDRPFVRGKVPAATIAGMAVVAERLRLAFPEARWGINVLRNDAASALAIAHAVGADFIRVNVLVGAVLADQGIIQGEAWELAQLRRQLDSKVAILADVAVKHAVPLAPYALEDQARDAVLRGGADALILSGAGTGLPADPRDFARVAAVLPDVPLLVGSGLTLETVEAFRACASGAIVASALKGPDGATDSEQVRAMVAQVTAGRSSSSLPA
ncbi:MAG: BtpA/SgcQ family protein [Candidatus Sericytochromatia bacterium]|nr:BtpA/SgcQ family protein [Candidatus Tanganyikabacteria bacterium]